MLHDRNVRGHAEGGPIAEPDVVIGLALEEVYPFVFETSVEVAERFLKKVWKKEKRGALIESLFIPS